MKALTSLTLAMILVATGAFAADPAEGVWKTAKDDNGNYGHIKIAACGTKICGTLVKSFDKTNKAVVSEHQGRKIIWDMVADGAGGYSGGKVYSPDRDKTYNSKMTLKGNALSVSGCVLGICRDGGTWTRLN